MKALVLFYSYGGNTRRVAKLVQQETGADLCEIETVTPYTGSYNAVVDQGQREVNSGFEPELKPPTSASMTPLSWEHRSGGIHLPRQCAHFWRTRIFPER